MDDQVFPVYMTQHEYRAVLAALIAVYGDGERRTDLTDGDKASTIVFGEIAASLRNRNGALIDRSHDG